MTIAEILLLDFDSEITNTWRRSGYNSHPSPNWRKRASPCFAPDEATQPAGTRAATV
jgi:hypothetical protein